MRSLLKKIASLTAQSVSIELNQQVKEYNSQWDKGESLIGMYQKQILMQMQKTDLNIYDLGFSVFSESDEDGILLYIFSKIGFGTKVCVDIGGGDGFAGSNTANLFLHHGFTGLVIEGKKENAQILKEAYLSKKATKHLTPRIISEYVSTDNINRLLESNGVKGEVDVLSIDIDGIDYWIWDAITVIEPRIVIVEIQCILDSNESKAVPKNFKNTVFETVDNKRYGIYNSASLKAFTKLAGKKGYYLVATSQLGFNAIFIKEALLTASLPAISVEQGLDKPFVKWAQRTFSERVNKLEWTEV